MLYCCYIEGERGLINFYYFFLALILRLLGEFTVVMSVTVEFSAVMLVTAEFTFVVLLRQRSVGSYSFTLLGGHALQALVACLALCHIVLDELL